MKYIYRTSFCLKYEVNDLDAAREYLTEDNMTKYLVNDIDFAEAIENIVWNLVTGDCGYIELTTNRELTENELDKVSDWVRGQNSDGLGEGFEQQWFAETWEDVEYTDYDEETGEYYTETEREYCGMASFDWLTNKYKFKLE